MRPDTIKAAHGRWREILAAVGIDPKFLTKKNGPCPLCGGTDRWSFTDRHGEGDYICRGCGAGKGVQLLMKLKGLDYAAAFNAVDKIIGNLPPPDCKPSFKTMSAADPVTLRRLYSRSAAISEGDAVALYLSKRRCSWSRALRYISEMKHRPSNTTHRGMLAVFSGPDGRPATIHRTYLTANGEKANVEPPRMFMPGKLPVGGAIRLHPAAHSMGVAEGIETALSARAIFDMPVWATTSAAMLEAWQPPPEAKIITVFGDNDRTHVGQAAAHALAKRLIHEAEKDKIERQVYVHIPSTSGQDWNDVQMGRL